MRPSERDGRLLRMDQADLSPSEWTETGQRLDKPKRKARGLPSEQQSGRLTGYIRFLETCRLEYNQSCEKSVKSTLALFVTRAWMLLK